MAGSLRSPARGTIISEPGASSAMIIFSRKLISSSFGGNLPIRAAPPTEKVVSTSGYQIYENAIIVPPAKTERGYNNRSGVFDTAGKFLEESITRSQGRNRHEPPELPNLDNIPFIEGTHTFGGIFFAHFGHFITESTGRLWTSARKECGMASFIFVPKEYVPAPRAISSQEKLLKALGINANLQIVGEPVRVERLIVPTYEFGLDPSLIDGSPVYRSFIQKAALNQAEPKGDELIYISRQGLPLDRGTILAESHLERLLEAEGYTIFKPQTVSAEKQIAQYKAAKKIISVDASPLHLYAYAARSEQKVSIIVRRSMNAHSNIVRHIHAFSNPEVHTIDVLVADYVRAGGKIGRSSWGEIDFQELGRQLQERGMVREGMEWKNPSRAIIDAQLSDLKARTGREYRRNYKKSDGIK